MIDFIDCKDCTDCTLRDSAIKPGIPTRLYYTERRDRVILIVGEAPGYYEDQAGESWIGRTGQLLAKFIEAAELPQHCDIYLANACRCRPPQKGKATKSQIKACHPYLLHDIAELQKEYKEVIILVCGAVAATSIIGGGSLADTFRMQGCSRLFNDGWVTLFFTYHPAILLIKKSTKRKSGGGRQPAKIHAIEAHFALLLRYLRGEFVPNRLQVVPDVGVSPLPLQDMPSVISVDIETYGIIKGVEQTVFHPVKSKEVDGIPYGKQVETVSFTYKDKKGKLQSPTYNYHDHTYYIERWFRNISKSGALLEGQNVKFDLLYLAANNKVLNYWISPCRLRVDDTLILSFLLDEHQPERGLKEMSTLYGIYDYSRLTVTGKTGTARSSRDPALYLYNAVDSATAYVMAEELLEMIRLRYGNESRKFSKTCQDMRNVVVWDTIGMERAGCALDIIRLMGVDADNKEKSGEAVEEAASKDVIIKGKGSEKSQREFTIAALVECGLLDDRRVKRTEKKKEISVGVENRELLLRYLPDEGRMREVVDAMQKYQTHSKIVNTYTSNLLRNKRKGIVHTYNSEVGMAYPSWYPVPSYYEMLGKEGKIGGTIQGRFSAKDPPIATFPPVIMSAIRSRYRGGIVKEYDLGQIELRMAAFLSNDPALMQAYVEGKDLHTQSALDIYPGIDPLADPNWKHSDERQLAKTLNFLVLYRGGPKAFQDTARREMGLDLTLDFCKEAIRKWDNAHQVFRAWQDSLVDTVADRGYLELVTGWTRSFGAGRANAEYAINDICNFPIQTISAQLAQTAQFKIAEEMYLQGLRALIVFQKYDSVAVDMLPDELVVVDEIADKYLTRPPLLPILERELGRTIPIQYEGKLLYGHTN